MFIDFISEENKDVLYALYKSALITVIPSLTKDETLCFVGIESQYNNTLVIASDVAGLQYITNKGKFGILFESGNKGALIRSIQFAIDNPQEVSQREISAKQYIEENFT